MPVENRVEKPWKSIGKLLEKSTGTKPQVQSGFSTFPHRFPQVFHPIFPRKTAPEFQKLFHSGVHSAFCGKNYTKGPHHTAFPLSPQRLSRSSAAPDFQWKRVGKNHPKMWKTKKANFRPLFFPPFPPPIIIIMVFYLLIKKKKETI